MDTLRNLKSPLPLPLCYSFLRLTLIHHTPHEDIPKPHSYFDLVLCSVFLYHFAERQFLIWIPSCFSIFFIKNMYHYFSLNLLMNDQFLLTQMFALISGSWPSLCLLCVLCIVCVNFSEDYRVRFPACIIWLFFLIVLNGLFDSAFFSRVHPDTIETRMSVFDFSCYYATRLARNAQNHRCPSLCVNFIFLLTIVQLFHIPLLYLHAYRHCTRAFRELEFNNGTQ